MPLVVHGSEELLLRFRGLVRTELGNDLRVLFNLDESSPAEAHMDSISKLKEPNATAVQLKFYGFLARIVRDPLTSTELEIMNDEHPPLYGSWWGPRQVLDLADIEAIPSTNVAYSRVGVLVHEIAERFWLSIMGFQYTADMREEDHLFTWYAPAHRYAINREAEVTGFVRESESGHSPIPRSEYTRWMYAEVPALVDAFSPIPLPSMETAMHLSYREYRPASGKLYPARRRVTIRARPLGPPRVEEVPINPRKPGPAGR
jgi:hypothetical protein